MPSPDWRHGARQLYELGLEELSARRENASTDDEFLVEELRDALLDLKEAFVADDAATGRRAMTEVWLLIRELNNSEE